MRLSSYRVPVSFFIFAFVLPMLLIAGASEPRKILAGEFGATW